MSTEIDLGTAEGILEAISIDSKVDQTNLDTELTRIPYLQSKWMKVYLRLNKDLRRAERIAAQTKLDRSNYYLGLAPESVYKEQPLNRRALKTDIPDLLACDPAYCRAKEDLDQIADLASAVEKFISSLNNRGFNLGKAVDYVRWKNGG